MRLAASSVCAIAMSVAISLPAESQERVTAIKARQIIDGTGGPPIADGIVIVRGDRIESVGTAASISVPSGADVVDLGAETLLPGLIDTHGHLSSRFGLPGLGLGAQQSQADGIQMLHMVRDARVALLCGVTTMRMTGESHWNDLHIKQAIERGVVPGPRMILGGAGISSTGGHGSPEAWVDGPWKAVKQVREHFAGGAEWFKVRLIDRTPEATLFTLEELTAVVDEAHRLGIKVTAHATGRWGSSIRTAIQAGVDNIEHARPMSEEIIQMMVEH